MAAKTQVRILVTAHTFLFFLQNHLLFFFSDRAGEGQTYTTFKRSLCSPYRGRDCHLFHVHYLLCGAPANVFGSDILFFLLLFKTRVETYMRLGGEGLKNTLYGHVEIMKNEDILRIVIFNKLQLADGLYYFRYLCTTRK